MRRYIQTTDSETTLNHIDEVVDRYTKMTG